MQNVKLTGSDAIAYARAFRLDAKRERRRRPCCGALIEPAPEHGPGFTKASCACGTNDSEF